MTEKVVAVHLQVLGTGTYRAEMQAAARDTRQFGSAVRAPGRDMAAMSQQMQTATARFRRFSTEVLGVSPRLLGAGGLLFALQKTARAAMEWESAWTGVLKTVDGTPAQLAAIEAGLRDMSTQLPTSAVELAKIAETAGQLGIETDQILGFTRVMADLGEATELSAEEAATALARLANIMQTPQDRFDELGSTIVDLGNNLAATEPEIVEMAVRIAGAGRQIGLTEAEVLSFAAALRSVGIHAEAGGTAISRVFLEMQTAVMEGGEELEAFARVAGMTAGEFVTAFRQDAAGAAISFIEGLRAVGDAGANTNAVLEQLSLQDVRVRDTLLRTAGAGDLVRQAIELGNRAWQENTALTEEAEKRYGTAASNIQIAGNAVTDLAVSIGQDMLPALTTAAEGVARLLVGINDLREGIKSTLDEWQENGNDFLTIGGKGFGDWSEDQLLKTLPVVGGMIDGIRKAGDAFDQARPKLHGFDVVASGMAEGVGTATGAVEAQAAALNELSPAAEGAESALDGFTSAVERMIGVHLAAESADIDFRDAVVELAEALEENGSNLDKATDAGRRNRDAVVAAADAALRHVEALIEEGRTADEVTGALEGHVAQLREVMGQAGLTEEEINGLIVAYGLTPENIRTLIELLGTDEALSEIEAIRRRLDAIPRHIRVVIRSDVTGRVVGGGGIPEFHSGGMVGDTSAPLRSALGMRSDEMMALVQKGGPVLSRRAAAALRNVHEGAPA